MASSLRRVGSSSGSLHQKFLKELHGKSSKVSIQDPEDLLDNSPVYYMKVNYPEKVSQLAEKRRGPNLNKGKAQVQQQVEDEDDSEDDFAALAEELSKVEAHSKLSTAVQMGFGGDVQNSVKRLGDSIVKVRQQGEMGKEYQHSESEDIALSSGDCASLFTAAHSLRRKLGSSQIYVDSSDYAASAVTAHDDVMSEYSASHDVDSIYSSPLSSKLMSHSGSTHNLLDSGKKPSADQAGTTGSPDNWQVAGVNQHTGSKGEGGVDDGTPGEVAAFDIPMDSATTVKAASTYGVPTRVSSTGDLVPLSYMEGSSWDVDGAVTEVQLLNGKGALEEQDMARGDQQRKFTFEELENLTPDQRLQLRVEELELKVNYLLAVRQSQLAPTGYMILAFPTIDYLRCQAVRSAHEMKERLVEGISSIWALRPLVPVINRVEEVAWAVFSRLPIVGVPECRKL